MANLSIFKTTSINVGDSVTMSITDLSEGKYGTEYVGTVNGKSVKISPSGNLKFLADDLAQGKRELNKVYTVTRKPDIKSKSGYNVTQFTITEGVVEVNTSTQTSSVADKLAAIRAKRGQATGNS